MNTNDQLDTYLKSIYYNAEHPASYGSINTLYEYSRKIFPHVSKVYVKEWLSNQMTYTLYRNARKIFTRNRIYVNHKDE